MNMKQYIANFSKPLLDDEMAPFILMWVEKEGISDIKEIKNGTGLPINVLDKILRELYQMGLIRLDKTGYMISNNGISVLDKLGLNDLLIESLLAQFRFKTKEKNLYINLLNAFRNNFLDEYLKTITFYNLFKKKHADNVNEDGVKNLYESNSFILVLLYSVGETLNSKKEYDSIKLFKPYNELYDYISTNDCYTRRAIIDVNQTNNRFDKKIKAVDNEDIIVDFSNLINKLSHSYRVKLKDPLNVLPNNIFNYSTYRKKIVEEDSTINGIMSCENLNEFAIRFNISKYNARMILADIKQKCEDLLE